MNDVIEFPTVFVCHQGPRLQEICQDRPYGAMQTGWRVEREEG